MKTSIGVVTALLLFSGIYIWIQWSKSELDEQRIITHLINVRKMWLRDGRPEPIPIERYTNLTNATGFLSVNASVYSLESGTIKALIEYNPHDDAWDCSYVIAEDGTVIRLVNSSSEIKVVSESREME